MDTLCPIVLSSTILQDIFEFGANSLKNFAAENSKRNCNIVEKTLSDDVSPLIISEEPLESDLLGPSLTPLRYAKGIHKIF